MIGVAWATAAEKWLFQQSPYVTKLNCTMDMNKENRPLLIATGCDSDGNSFTVLHVFLPNQRMWAFHWILQTEISALLGSDIKHIQMIDSKEKPCWTMQYHVIFHKFNVDGILLHMVGLALSSLWQCFDAINKLFYKICQNILAWLYSWLEAKEKHKRKKTFPKHYCVHKSNCYSWNCKLWQTYRFHQRIHCSLWTECMIL